MKTSREMEEFFYLADLEAQEDEEAPQCGNCWSPKVVKELCAWDGHHWCDIWVCADCLNPDGGEEPGDGELTEKAQLEFMGHADVVYAAMKRWA